MAAPQIALLLDLFDCMLATRSAASALFTLACEKESTNPDEAQILRSIARAHRVRMLLLEAQLAALNDGPDRLTVEPY